MSVTRKEIVEGVKNYVQRRYAGDWKAAFDAEDEDQDGLLSTGEVAAILAKSGVGFRLTRWAVALSIVQLMDIDADGKVSFAEFEKLTS